LERLENWLFSGFAALAVVLAVLGLYGLISHEVELSRRDIGIRIAVGATYARIFGLVNRRVGWMLGSGLVLGGFSAWAVRRLLGTVVAIRPERDVLVLSLLAVLFVAVAFLAALVPARRAAAVDPMTSLRAE
jgi:ABC-type antimicrobial peptide transport system permease subunit